MMILVMFCLEVEVKKRLSRELAALDLFSVHHNVIVPFDHHYCQTFKVTMLLYLRINIIVN